MPALACPACGALHSEFDSRCPGCGAALPELSGAGATRVTRIEPVAWTEDEPLSGQQVAHFRILGRLGSGGMGVVYRALDLELDREVALKLLHPQREGRERDQARFRREAQAAAGLDHPNIGTVHEVGESGGRPFIAMALYDGETLAARLARQPDRRLPLSEAAAVAGQLASALEAAHAAGLVHRDLKPENVLILRDGRVKLIDFGLAHREGASRITEQGLAVGTAAYMAPEQLRNQEVGSAADLWALGVVLYEMLAGRHPFGGERQGMVHNVLYEDPAPLADAPAEIEALVARCLAKEPRDRLTAHDAVAGLQASGLWASSGSGAVAPLPRPLSRGGSRRLWAGIGAAAAVLIALLIAAYLLTRKPAPPVYVAVLKPEVSGSLEAADRARVAANLQTALLRTVAALQGLAALDSSQVNAVPGPPAAVARAVAAGEVVASRADCAGDLCQVSLSRLAGQDGRVLWTEALQLPPSQSRLFADAVAVSLRSGYPARDLRVPRLALETSDEDYRAYLDLRRRAADPAAYPEVLDGLGALRRKAPAFLEVYSLEANVARRLYLVKRDARYLERGLDVARQAHERAPGDPRPLANLFDLYLDANRYDEAGAVLAQLATSRPGGEPAAAGPARRAPGASSAGPGAPRRRGAPATLLALAAHPGQRRIPPGTPGRRAPPSGGSPPARPRQRRTGSRRWPRSSCCTTRIAPSPCSARSRPPPRTPTPLTNLGVALLLRRRYGEAERSLRDRARAPAGLPLGHPQPRRQPPPARPGAARLAPSMPRSSRRGPQPAERLGEPRHQGPGARPPRPAGPRRGGDPAGAAPHSRQRPARL